MKTWSLFAAAALLCFACQNQPAGGGAPAADSSAHAQHHHGGANAYMHRSDFAALLRRFNDPARDAWQQPDALLDRLGDLKNQSVADLGAGGGYFTFRLAGRAGRVLALEPDSAFADYLRRRADSLKATNVDVRRVGYDDCGLKPAEVDQLLLVNTYHHIEGREAYFRRLRAGLKPGGRLWVVDFKDGKLPVGPPPDHKIPAAQVLRELAAAGFSETVLDTSLLRYQFVVTAR